MFGISVSQDILNYDSVQLLVGGLDTIATLEINNMHIASTDNMFRRYILDVKSALQVCICMYTHTHTHIAYYIHGNLIKYACTFWSSDVGTDQYYSKIDL